MSIFRVRICQYGPCNEPAADRRAYCNKEHQRLATKARHRGEQVKIRFALWGPKITQAIRTDARFCDGCKWVKDQPGSDRGVECTRGTYRACAPFSTKPRFYEEA